MLCFSQCEPLTLPPPSPPCAVAVFSAFPCVLFYTDALYFSTIPYHSRLLFPPPPTRLNFPSREVWKRAPSRADPLPRPGTPRPDCGRSRGLSDGDNRCSARPPLLGSPSLGRPSGPGTESTVERPSSPRSSFGSPPPPASGHLHPSTAASGDQQGKKGGRAWSLVFPSALPSPAVPEPSPRPAHPTPAPTCSATTAQTRLPAPRPARLAAPARSATRRPSDAARPSPPPGGRFRPRVRARALQLSLPPPPPARKSATGER